MARHELAFNLRWPASKASRMERETGIEPATNSLEGCDSTTELLPPTRCPLRPRLQSGHPPHSFQPMWPAMSEARRAESNGGEGRVRTSVAARAADLQSAAIDRSATSPFSLARPSRPAGPLRSRAYARAAPRPLGVRRTHDRKCFLRCFLQTDYCTPSRARLISAKREAKWSWRRDLNPRPADYKSAALPG